MPGPAIDDYVAMVTAGGTKTFFHTDKMGSVVAMSDLSGNLAEGPYTYDAYGYCASGGAACGAGVPFRFTGQRYDAESALYYYRARMYSIITGRFLQTDPIGYDDDLDAYTYVGNDPTDATDPSGDTRVICWLEFYEAAPGAATCITQEDNSGQTDVTYNFTQHVRNWGPDGGWSTSHWSTSQTLSGNLHDGFFSTNADFIDKQLTAFVSCSHHCESHTGSMDIAAAAAMAAGVVPLKLIHSPEAMCNNQSSTNFWSKKSTDEIINSLKPGEPESLKVKADGTVVNGQTRLQILQSRGVDINSLPREPYP